MNSTNPQILTAVAKLDEAKKLIAEASAELHVIRSTTKCSNVYHIKQVARVTPEIGRIAEIIIKLSRLQRRVAEIDADGTEPELRHQRWVARNGR